MSMMLVFEMFFLLQYSTLLSGLCRQFELLSLDHLCEIYWLLAGTYCKRSRGIDRSAQVLR